MHLGGERRCESRVSCPRTQHNIPGQGSKPGPLDPESSSLTMRPLRLPLQASPKSKPQNWLSLRNARLSQQFHLVFNLKQHWQGCFNFFFYQNKDLTSNCITKCMATKTFNSCTQPPKSDTYSSGFYFEVKK